MGCETLMPAEFDQGNSHSTEPSSGASPAARRPVTTSICRRPPSVTSIGEVYEAASLRAPHAGAPVRAL